MLRLFTLLSVFAALGGCAGMSARMGDDIPQERLRSDNKSIVLLHTSLHEASCSTIMATLAQLDSSGRYVYERGGIVALKGAFDDKKLPSQIVLPAGDYGIVSVKCNAPYRNRTYTARLVQRGRIPDGSGAIYEKPIATCKVGIGEVIDIGSLRLPSTPTGLFETQRPEFIAVVTTIPEAYLKNLAEANPQLHERRTIRQMIAGM